MEESNYIQTAKYQLEIRRVLESNEMEIVLAQKRNNTHMKFMVGTVPDEWMDGDEGKAQRKLNRFREMHIQPSVPAIRQHNHEEWTQLVLVNQAHLKCNQKQTEATDKEINFGIKYWSQEENRREVKLVFDPHNSQIHIFILQKTPPVRAAQAVITADSLLSNQKQSLQDLFTALQERELKCSQTQLILKHQLLNEIPLQNSVTVPEKEGEEETKSGRLTLFIHIFLTQLITHMIINRFRRREQKHKKEREGYDQMQYQDEELEVLRNWGYRMYSFRDHPIKWGKKRRKSKVEKELDSLDEVESQEEDEGEEDNKSKKPEKVKKEGKKESKDKKPKTVIQKMGLKIKNVKNDKKKQKEICNFTFMSGYEKSQINKIRYSMHQMTRETDHTQALMDFVRLAFNAVPKKNLLGICRKTIYHIEGKKQVKYQYEKGEMSRFLGEIKVKRQVLSCLREYTKDSFFHEILNIGLRVLHTPYQLVYLRLAFSHMFWSIKLMHHRQKRAVEEKKNEERTVRLYRGCSVTEEEVKQLKANEGGYIQAEGFLSTSMLESVTEKFKKNLLMRIEVPAANLKGMLDNGFADISLTSSFSAEKEVLFNTFNIFKVLSFRKAKMEQQSSHFSYFQEKQYSFSSLLTDDPIFISYFSSFLISHSVQKKQIYIFYE